MDVYLLSIRTNKYIQNQKIKDGIDNQKKNLLKAKKLKIRQKPENLIL